MLYEVMQHIRNFFPRERLEGRITIKDGTVSLPFLREGMYFLIEGSVLNDGLYKYPAELQDEEFIGCVTLCAPPKDFVALVDEIKVYAQEKPPVFNAESFGGYSRSNYIGWQDAYKSRLNTWRKA